MGKILKYEKYLFLLVSLANLLPLFYAHFFPTLDGPAHLYNARIIQNLIGNTNPVIAEYYCFNGYHLTNWTGHLILVLFNSFLPAWMAEKVLMAIILIGLPYAFRGFINKIAKDKSLLVYLIFPFTWCQLFMHGFFNHLLGMIALLLVLMLWMDKEARMSFRSWLLLFLSFTFAAGSHIFAFLMALALAGGYTIWSLLVREKAISFSAGLKLCIKKLGFLILSATGGFIILAFYLIVVQVTRGAGKIPGDIWTSLNDIRTVKPLLAIAITEQMFTAKMFYWLGLMSLVAIVIRFYLYWKDKKGMRLFGPIRFGITSHDFLLFASLITFAMFIWFDVYDNTGLYINSRLLFLAFVLWIAWIALQKFHPAFAILSVVAFITINFILISGRVESYKANGKQVDEFIEIADYMDPGSIVYPVNFSSNWLFFHVPDYISVEKPLVVLDNYECNQKYFPLTWRPAKRDIKAVLDQAYPGIMKVLPDSTKAFDYLMTFAEAEAIGQSDFDFFQAQLNRDFELVAISHSGFIHVYRQKK